MEGKSDGFLMTCEVPHPGCGTEPVHLGKYEEPSEIFGRVFADCNLGRNAAKSNDEAEMQMVPPANT